MSTKERFEPSRLAELPDVVARLVPAERLFAWMSRSFVVPIGWAALAMRLGRDARLAGPGERYEDEETQDVLFVRTSPSECTVAEPDLQSADGFACRGVIRVRVKVVAEPAELGAFRKNLTGSGSIVRQADIERYLQWQLRKVLADLAASRPAAELMQPLDAAEVRRRIDERLGVACLTAGLAIDGPITVEFSSPAWSDHRREQAVIQTRSRRAEARGQIEEALAKARRERLAGLIEVLEPLLRAAEARRDLSLTALLKTFSESQRGDLYDAMWHLSTTSQHTRYVVAVSGQEVLLFEPKHLDEPVRRLCVPDCLGPLRSVRIDVRSAEAGLLMVGARLGVHLLNIDSGQVARSLGIAVENPDDVLGGVNAVATTDERIYATHSETGLLAWPRNDGNTPADELLTNLTGPADTVRSVQAAEGHVWLTIDEDVWTFAIDDVRGDRPVHYPGSTARLSALTVADKAVYAGNIHGQILAWHIGDPDSARVLRGATGSPVESISVVQPGGVDHLIVADRGPALQAMVVDDGYVRRYESNSVPIRRAVVADDLFVAMNDNRDRLIAWDPRAPNRPIATVIIPYLTNNTIQDLCLIPQV